MAARDGGDARVSWAGTVLAVSFAYAVLRYVLLKDTPPDQLPLFVANKAVAVTAAVLVAAATGARSPQARRSFGFAGLAFAGLHLLLTVPLLSPAYYSQLFGAPPGGAPPGGAPRWNLAGGLALLTGAAALTGLTLLAWPSAELARFKRAAAPAILAVVAAHAVALGSRSWWRPAEWPGGLPPMSLAAVVAGAAALALARSRRGGVERSGGAAPAPGAHPRTR
jgi:hypothetical protein